MVTALFFQITSVVLCHGLEPLLRGIKVLLGIRERNPFFAIAQVHVSVKIKSTLILIFFCFFG